MSHIMYSVIVPHYGDGARLERLLSSIPINRPDVEVIVVDDCSPDQAAFGLLKARWPGVRWLSTPQNTGAGGARNVGLAHARGLRVLFADSDDEFTPAAFDVFDKYIEPDDELVYFLAEAIQEVDGAPSTRTNALNGLIEEYLAAPMEESLERLKMGHVTPWGKVYSRDFIEESGVKFEETPVSNDVAFNVVAAVQANRVRAVPEQVYRSYRRQGSLTADQTSGAFIQRLEVVARLATSLRAYRVRALPSGTGWMLMSLAYGPSTAYRAWRICLGSDLRIDVFRVFQVSRWREFIRSRLSNRKEKREARGNSRDKDWRQ